MSNDEAAAGKSREDGIEECAKWHEAQSEKCAERAKAFLDYGDIESNGHQADEAQFHMHCAVSLRMLLSRLQPAAAGEAPISAEAVNTEKLQAVIQSLAGALEPFEKWADASDIVGCSDDLLCFSRIDDGETKSTVTIGDIRRARSALASLREGG